MAWFSWFRHDESELEMKLLHDLGNSLTCIKGYSQLLLSNRHADPEALEKIDFCSQQAIGLMQDLMDQESLKRGDLTLRRKPIIIEDLLARVAGGFEVICRSKGIKIRTSIHSDGTLVLADARRVAQVLSNLISNAVRHTFSGGSIVISVLPQEDCARITVQDTGEGIPFEHQAKIFDKFYQAGKNSGSMGLGLSICQEIVMRHNGQIGVTSAGEGRGSCFYFTLPYGASSVPAPKTDSSRFRTVTGGMCIVTALMCLFVFRSEMTGLIAGQSGVRKPAPIQRVDTNGNELDTPESMIQLTSEKDSWPPHKESSPATQPPTHTAGNIPAPESLYSAEKVARVSEDFRHERLVDSLGEVQNLESKAARSGLQFDGSVLQAKASPVAVAPAWDDRRPDIGRTESAPHSTNARTSAVQAPLTQTMEPPPIPDNIVMDATPESRWTNPFLLIAGGIGIAGALMLGSSLQLSRKSPEPSGRA